MKMALVNRAGSISNHKKVSTASLRQANNFVGNFLNVVSAALNRHPNVRKIGIGIPGTLNKNRTVTLEVPAIPQLNGVEMGKALNDSFPHISFCLENDANAAALGEYYFPKDNVKMPSSFIFLTMGTGIGGAAIINGRIFHGADGNGMEVGHIFSRNSTLLENNIGKQGIINLAKTYLKDFETKNSLDHETLTSADIVLAAVNGDKVALQVFSTVGQILGEALISVIRILDIKTIIIGGGLSSSFEFVIDSLKQVLLQHLTPYYTKDLFIKRATLANQAGIIGAASLCFE
jgi:glucokinase